MPKYLALTSFVGTDGNGKTWSVSAGDVLDSLPVGTDWATCGFLEPIKPVRKPTTRRRKAPVKKAE